MSSDVLEGLVPRFSALAKDFNLDVFLLEDEDFLSCEPLEPMPTRTATYINVSSLNLCGGWMGAVMPPIVELARVGNGSTSTSGA